MFPYTYSLFLTRLLQSENAAARAEQLDNQQVVVDFVPSSIETNEDHQYDDDVKSIATQKSMFRPAST